MKYKPSHTYEMIPLSLEQKAKSEAVQQEMSKSNVDKLRELKQMLDEKLITQEEYEKAKKKILEEPQK